MRRAFTYTSGIMAVALYLFVVWIAFFIFNSNREVIIEKNKTQKPKAEEIIAIDMSKIESLDEKKVDNNLAPPPSNRLVKQQEQKLEKVTQNKPQETKEVEQKKVIEEKIEPVISTKTPEINKVIKAVKTKNIEIKTPIIKAVKNDTLKTSNAKDLFSNIKTQNIDDKQNKTSVKDMFNKLNHKETAISSKQSNESIASKTSGNGATADAFGEGKKKQDGVPQEYINGIKKRLNSWPASEQYYGEIATVNYVVKTSGAFTFTVTAKNRAFKEELIEYLSRLQTRGFEPHDGGRAWSFKTTFTAGD
jgi:hypothetical protein